MGKIRVMLVDDYEQIFNYFKIIVESEEDMEVVASVMTGEEAVKKAIELRPDVILMDIQMETDTAGVVATEKIKEQCPEIKIIVLTIHDDDDIILNAYIAGANDFLVKTSSAVTIIDSIRKVYNNNLAMRPEISEKVVGALTKLNHEKQSLLYMINMLTKLTAAELYILKQVYSGHTYRQIAKMRFVEEGTVRSQVNHILTKLQFHKMKDLIKYMDEMNLGSFFQNL